MKILVTLFLSLIVTKGCVHENDFKDVKLVYEASSRGFQRTITLENKTFAVVSARNAKPTMITLTEEQWNKIGMLYSKIDLNTYNALKGPTEERFYDGKPAANLRITVKEKEYETQGFDHTIPPAELKELIDYINEIAAQK